MDKDKSAHNNLKKKKKYYSNKIEGSLENSSTQISHNNRTTREREREGERSDQRRKWSRNHTSADYGVTNGPKEEGWSVCNFIWLGICDL